MSSNNPTGLPVSSSSSSSSSSLSTAQHHPFTPLTGNLTITDQANAFIEPEIEYRLRYIIQEAWKFAQQAHKDKLLPIHIELAWKLLSSSGRDGYHGITSSHWIPHAGSTSSRLCVGGNTTIPIATVSASVLQTSLHHTNQIIDATNNNNPSTIASYDPANSNPGFSSNAPATTTREASALLAAITTAINTSSDTVTATNEIEENDENSVIMKITTLLVQFQLNSAQQLQFFIPKIISILRSTLESNILSINQSMNGNSNTLTTLQAYRQQRKILRIITALITNYSIPIESIIGEILAILCSIILYQIKIVDTKVKDYSLIVQEDSRTRNYASKVITALVNRYANIWPDIHSQASLVILDGLSNSIEILNTTAGTNDDHKMVDDSSSTTSAAASSPSFRIVSWNSLYGAAITLSVLPKVPVDAIIPLTMIIRQYITEQYASNTSHKKHISPYDQLWSTLCMDALNRILQQHSNHGTTVNHEDDDI